MNLRYESILYDTIRSHLRLLRSQVHEVYTKTCNAYNPFSNPNAPRCFGLVFLTRALGYMGLPYVGVDNNTIKAKTYLQIVDETGGFNSLTTLCLDKNNLNTIKDIVTLFNNELKANIRALSDLVGDSYENDLLHHGLNVFTISRLSILSSDELQELSTFISKEAKQWKEKE